MIRRFDYDSTQEPAAPVLPVRIGPPGGSPSVLIVALVDSGAEISVVPERVAADLGLPAIGALTVRGVGGVSQRATLHAAAIDGGGIEEIVEVLALGGEAVLGRDLLNRWVVTMDGPRKQLRLSA